ncbi:restriction endonuclease [bacterium]|nr:restriction endonuclease [bacterium]
MGYKSYESFGETFKNKIDVGDIILIAQGSNNNKTSYLCGSVCSVAINESINFEKYETKDVQSIQLTDCVYKEELENLILDFTDCAYGESSQIPSLYQLYPLKNLNDKRITDALDNQIIKKRIEKIMDKIKITKDEKDQIIKLWCKYKGDNGQIVNQLTKDYDLLIDDWVKYKVKIENDTLELKEYTNILKNSENSEIKLPGTYLCNFLERTTSEIFGSSKPGYASNFGIKLNKDNITYTIKYDSKNIQENESKVTAEDYYKNNIKKILKFLIEENNLNEIGNYIENLKGYQAKQILMKMIVLRFPTDLLHIYSSKNIDDLFSLFFEDEDLTKTIKSNMICSAAKNFLNVDINNHGEIVLMSRFLFELISTKAIADDDNPNIIFYGAPGTGKTFFVKNSIKFLCNGDSSKYEIVQFHPSFSYEDFIEGIKPKGISENGSINFELVNGVFKNFCIKAKSNPNEKYYFIVDEINRANLSSVFGETLSLLEKDYRHNPNENNTDSDIQLLKTQYSPLIEKLIKENKNTNKYDKLAYEYIENKGVMFGIPNNVYFIGMMNDVDKSIDTFDLALRRRFKWIRTECDYSVIEATTKFKDKAEYTNIIEYIDACKELNKFISNTLNLGKSYEFGHSFFMNISKIAKRKTISKANIENLFHLYLEPTLKEYLRSEYPEDKIKEQLDSSLTKFEENFK